MAHFDLAAVGEVHDEFPEWFRFPKLANPVDGHSRTIPAI
jgi:hypothetical protein